MKKNIIIIVLSILVIILIGFVLVKNSSQPRIQNLQEDNTSIDLSQKNNQNKIIQEVITPISNNHNNIKDKTIVIGEPFELSVGESVYINKDSSINFLEVVGGIQGTCGDDVKNCPDSFNLLYQNDLTGEIKNFSLPGMFVEYNIGNVNILIMSKVSDNTYKFKVSSV